MSFIASSELWGESSIGRICEIIVASNDGAFQQIKENRTDLLDHLSKDQLEQTDDLGLSLPFLAVYFDRPESIIYLHKRGLDLNKPCDPVGFGTPMFYAINLRKPNIVKALDRVGYSISSPCETVFNYNAIKYAERNDDHVMLDMINNIHKAQNDALELLRKNFLKTIYRKKYLRKRYLIIKIQKIVRGYIIRRYFKRAIAGLLEEDSASVNSQISHHSNESKNSSDIKESLSEVKVEVISSPPKSNTKTRLKENPNSQGKKPQKQQVKQKDSKSHK